jgi:hypothetical protein
MMVVRQCNNEGVSEESRASFSDFETISNKKVF